MRSASQEPNNTPLHEAILARDNVRALALISNIPESELNLKSLGNTPLMLALKTANFPIALAILQRKDAAVVSLTVHGEKNDPSVDDRGVSPLQLACAWRQPEVILAVLNHYQAYLSRLFECDFDIKELFAFNLAMANSLQFRVAFTPTLWPGVNPMMKSVLTKRDVICIYHRNDDPAKILNDLQDRKFLKGIKESSGLVIISAPELTDALLFHTKLICLNLGLKSADEFKEFPTSFLQFASDLNIGWRAIIDWRNNQPLDARVVEILGEETKNQPQHAAKK